MTNFDVFAQDKDFAGFAAMAVAGELAWPAFPAACALDCRAALEGAVRWAFSVDKTLPRPYSDELASMLNVAEFRKLLRPAPHMMKFLDFIRKTGNAAAHGGKPVTAGQAELCLQNLFAFFDFLATCYCKNYKQGQFDPSLMRRAGAPASPAPAPAQAAPAPELKKLEELTQENAALRDELTRRRAERQATYAPKTPEISEYATRKLYIDFMLADAGWVEGKNWLNEYQIPGMPNQAAVGYADYALLGNDGKVLAVVEAKRTCADVAKGRQQAKLYADLIEQRQGRRPVIFLSNGFDTRIDDGWYPERPVAALYSRRDLEKLFNLRAARQDLTKAGVAPHIAGRYYQAAAARAVFEAFSQNRRKALLVMATGSGKTRTVIALVEALLKNGWARDVLFLADRNALVTQAKRAFVNLLPSLSVTNLCESKSDPAAHGVFSTYQTMMNCIDAARDEEGKLFSPGHFDLVICDEAHRSIYNKYRDIFTYFDAPLVGLTATPKDEIDKNTYEVFELENGVPTYGYDLAQAVKDGFLVDFRVAETQLKFLQQGIVYDELSEADKEAYEDTFGDEEGNVPDSIGAGALNDWLFNADTIRQALRVLMGQGLKIDYGMKLGKTIVFAKNHRHAEKILEVFGKEYPELPGFAKVIDNHVNYAQSAIDEFSDPKKLPQIAISVDMLDTGIDVPEVLNLVFFKRVLSRAKFWQMIGRGTRLCPGLIDGVDKSRFYIFDLCGNFEFFRVSAGRAAPETATLQAAIYQLQFAMAMGLQGMEYQTPELRAFRERLVQEMAAKVRKLKRDNFAVRQHLQYVEMYEEPSRYQTLTHPDTLIVREELAPLLPPDDADPKALRFDALLYNIELAILTGKGRGRLLRDLRKKAAALSTVANIPEVTAQAETITRVLHGDFLEHAAVSDFEDIRERLRDLMKYLPNDRIVYDTNFTDELLGIDWGDAPGADDGLKNYREKAEAYLKRHKDKPAVAKLYGNQPLTGEDVRALEDLLWREIGTRDEYEAECGQKPLGEFVREIVGLDANAAKAAFAEFLDANRLDSQQVHFVNQIVEFIVENGMMPDLSVLQKEPFTAYGGVSVVFGEDLPVWERIRAAIAKINANARAG